MSMRQSLKIWRESSSLILAAKSVFSQPNLFDYKILCMKRSSKLKFMPETYVFPGGAMSKSDSDEKWWKLYEKFGFRQDSFTGLKSSKNEPAILDNGEKNGGLPKYLSFRICAIRETFEECGILLCKNPDVDHDINSQWGSFIGGSEIMKWQDKVHDNAEEFLNMCTEFNIYPDVWALKTWSNWLTPPSLKLRFNAIFFLTSLNQMPGTNKNIKEVQDLIWATPEESITRNQKEDILIPPPQAYEISRLRTIPHIDKLAQFANERAKYGCETFWPYRIQCKDEVYSILPGDDMYPPEIDETKTDVPLLSELPECKTLNRMLHKNEYRSIIKTQNYTPKCNHLTPHPTE